MKGLDEAARCFAELFEQRGLPYAIMGGLAVRIYALPRPTFDVDFTIAIPREALHDLYRTAESLGFSIPINAAHWMGGSSQRAARCEVPVVSR